MGLYKGMVHNILRALICCPAQMIKERLTYQGRRYKEKREKKLSIKKHNIPNFGLGGFSHKKRREELSEERNMSTKIDRYSIWDRYVYSFEPIPEKVRL
jgi:hypothetical protein